MKLQSKHGISYRVGNQAEILCKLKICQFLRILLIFDYLDSASGNSQDHAYGQYGIPISYTYEMRGTGDYGNYGFFLPPEHIIPNAEEVLESFIGLVKKARDDFGRFQ